MNTVWIVLEQNGGHEPDAILAIRKTEAEADAVAKSLANQPRSYFAEFVVKEVSLTAEPKVINL